MMGTINNWVHKVVDTVSGPLYAWGSTKKSKKSGNIKKSVKCNHVRKCKCN